LSNGIPNFSKQPIRNSTDYSVSSSSTSASTSSASTTVRGSTSASSSSASTGASTTARGSTSAGSSSASITVRGSTSTSGVKRHRDNASSPVNKSNVDDDNSSCSNSNDNLLTGESVISREDSVISATMEEERTQKKLLNALLA
jgi:hypothetical protein